MSLQSRERSLQSCPKVADTRTADNSSALVFLIQKKKKKKKREMKQRERKEGRKEGEREEEGSGANY